MTEPTKEQIAKWEIESDALLNYFGHDDWGSAFFSKKEAFKIGYLKAKKSDFEEIKTLKEQLAEFVKLAKLGVYSVEGLLNYNHESWELSAESWLLKTKTLLEKQKRQTLSKDEK